MFVQALPKNVIAVEHMNSVSISLILLPSHDLFSILFLPYFKNKNKDNVKEKPQLPFSLFLVEK